MDRRFRAEIDLARLPVALNCTDAAGGSIPFCVTAVEPIEPSLDAAWPEWSQKDGVLSLSLDAKAFAYRIVF